MKKLFRYLRPYKWQVVLIIILTTIQSLSQLYLPSLMSDIVDDGVVGKDIALIINTGLVMLGFTAIVTVSTVLSRYFSSRNGCRLCERPAKRYFQESRELLSS